ncbi:hypothetical protein [Vibrio phage LV6]|nr:hypothetical protein [Vibrio phage LV6]
MSNKTDQLLAELLTDRNNCIKSMSQSWQVHYGNNEHAPLSLYIETLHKRIKQLTRQEALRND